MFKITFSPQYSFAEPMLEKQGDALIVNGVTLDFSNFPEGGELPPEAIDNPFIVGGVERKDGVIHMTILLPYSNPNAPQSVTFPEPILITEDGPIALPEGRYAD